MYKRYVKRLLDLVLSIILLVILLLPMIIVWVIIKVTSPGAPVFTQKRLGRNEKEFLIYKFRTMRVEREKDGRVLSDVERTTKVGSMLRKLSIDELPQLINVVRGDMSFIGPRPLYSSYLEFYTEEQKRRHDVRPGISGWAQVNGRNAIEWDAKFEYDIEYVEKISFAFDGKVVIKTFKVLLIMAGINKDKNVTMEHFRGNTVISKEKVV